MIKKFYLKKMFLSTSVLFTIMMICLFPKSEETIKGNNSITYVSKEINTYPIYLMDQNNLLARTKVAIEKEDTISKIKELVCVLTKDSKCQDKVPSGFLSVIPENTKINSLSIDNNVLKIDFSEELMNVSFKQEEEKVIEAIVYTLTEIPEIENIVLYMKGDILNKLPQSKINLPSTLNRNIGINKQYDLKSYQDVSNVTIYYVSSYNDEYYYVPVTKYMNSSKDKIKIIVDELSSGSTTSSNLMSFLNSNTKLLATDYDVDKMFLVFNEYIFNDMDEKNILEEVLYTLNLSIRDNYDVSEVF